MTTKEELREIISGIVRDETRALANEAKSIIAEIVREELVPELRAAVRESIAKELGYPESDVHTATEKMPASDELAVSDTQASPEESVAVDRLSSDEDLHEDHGQGLYLYGLIDLSTSTRLGKIGIDESEVYTIPFDGISAIVHDCPLEPYKSDKDATVTAWVKVHQRVMDVAAERFGNVMPFGFDTIISPKDNSTAKDALMKWLSDEHDNILRKLDKIKGKKEYGVQVFYVPTIFGERVEKESEDMKRMKEEISSKPPGLAYMYKQKLENMVKVELDALMDDYFKNFYEKIRSVSDDIKVEKVKKVDDGMVMMMNLSVLARDEKGLGSVLDEIDGENGITVRFTGPWQPYSFI